MSPVVKRKRDQFRLPTKYLLLVLSLVCVGTMVLSFATDIFSKPLNYISGYVVVPFQKGLTNVGTYIISRTDNLKTLEAVMAENKELTAKVDELTKQNIELQQDKYELTQLRNLYELDDEYDEYEKIGARIIARDSGNWYANFVIDKGTNDGVQIDCNIMAGNGLIGRVTDVGPDYAKVTSIISDNINTSGMILATGDILIVTGDLELMKKGVIEFSQLNDDKNVVSTGDKVVTSNISDKYLPGLLIGYIDNISTDSNNLTKSGTLIPAADFKHLEEVLVVLDIKKTVSF